MVKIIEKYKSGATISDLCDEYGISTSTFYAWKLRFGFPGPTQLDPLQRLQKENRRLREQILTLSVQNDRLKGLIRRSQVTR
jgi:putative transposase